jgi:hypothetical protein
VLEKDSKGNVIYLRTKAAGQTRTVYLAYGYSRTGEDVSSIRVVDKTYDNRDKCYIVLPVKPSQPPQEATSAPPSPFQGASPSKSKPRKSKPQRSPDIEAAKKTVAQALAIAEAAKKAAEEAKAATEIAEAAKKAAEEAKAATEAAKAQEKARKDSEKRGREEAEREKEAERKEEAKRKEEAEKQIEKEAEANKKWREKIDEAHTNGLGYAKKRESKWSLIETNNPMTDGKDYTVKSTQLNEKGAVAEIDGTCKKPGEVVFKATVLQTPDRENPIGLPDHVDYIAGEKASRGAAQGPGEP